MEEDLTTYECKELIHDKLIESGQLLLLKKLLKNRLLHQGWVLGMRQKCVEYAQSKPPESLNISHMSSDLSKVGKDMCPDNIRDEIKGFLMEFAKLHIKEDKSPDYTEPMEEDSYADPHYSLDFQSRDAIPDPRAPKWIPAPERPPDPPSSIIPKKPIAPALIPRIILKPTRRVIAKPRHHHGSSGKLLHRPGPARLGMTSLVPVVKIHKSRSPTVVRREPRQESVSRPTSATTGASKSHKSRIDDSNVKRDKAPERRDKKRESSSASLKPSSATGSDTWRKISSGSQFEPKVVGKEKISKIPSSPSLSSISSSSSVSVKIKASDIHMKKRSSSPKRSLSPLVLHSVKHKDRASSSGGISKRRKSPTPPRHSHSLSIPKRRTSPVVPTTKRRASPASDKRKESSSRSSRRSASPRRKSSPHRSSSSKRSSSPTSATEKVKKGFSLAVQSVKRGISPKRIKSPPPKEKESSKRARSPFSFSKRGKSPISLPTKRSSSPSRSKRGTSPPTRPRNRSPSPVPKTKRPASPIRIKSPASTSKRSSSPSPTKKRGSSPVPAVVKRAPSPPTVTKRPSSPVQLKKRATSPKRGSSPTPKSGSSSSKLSSLTITTSSTTKEKRGAESPPRVRKRSMSPLELYSVKKTQEPGGVPKEKEKDKERHKDKEKDKEKTKHSRDKDKDKDKERKSKSDKEKQRSSKNRGSDGSKRSVSPPIQSPTIKSTSSTSSLSSLSYKSGIKRDVTPPPIPIITSKPPKESKSSEKSEKEKKRNRSKSPKTSTKSSTKPSFQIPISPLKEPKQSSSKSEKIRTSSPPPLSTKEKKKSKSPPLSEISTKSKDKRSSSPKPEKKKSISSSSMSFSSMSSIASTISTVSSSSSSSKKDKEKKSEKEKEKSHSKSKRSVSPSPPPKTSKKDKKRSSSPSSKKEKDKSSKSYSISPPHLSKMPSTSSYLSKSLDKKLNISTDMSPPPPPGPKSGLGKSSAWSYSTPNLAPPTTKPTPSLTYVSSLPPAKRAAISAPNLSKYKEPKETGKHTLFKVSTPAGKNISTGSSSTSTPSRSPTVAAIIPPVSKSSHSHSSMTMISPTLATTRHANASSLSGRKGSPSQGAGFTPSNFGASSSLSSGLSKVAISSGKKTKDDEGGKRVELGSSAPKNSDAFLKPLAPAPVKRSTDDSKPPVIKPSNIKKVGPLDPGSRIQDPGGAFVVAKSLQGLRPMAKIVPSNLGTTKGLLYNPPGGITTPRTTFAEAAAKAKFPLLSDRSIGSTIQAKAGLGKGKALPPSRTPAKTSPVTPVIYNTPHASTSAYRTPPIPKGTSFAESLSSAAAARQAAEAARPKKKPVDKEKEREKLYPAHLFDPSVLDVFDEFEEDEEERKEKQRLARLRSDNNPILRPDVDFASLFRDMAGDNNDLDDEEELMDV